MKPKDCTKMPVANKGKNKKIRQDIVPERPDFTRRPLPGLEPCSAKPTPRAEREIVSAHFAFEKWNDEALDAENWGVTGETLFKDDEGRSCLPSKLSKLVVGWVRPSELVVLKTEGSADDIDKACEGASRKTQAKGAVADKKRKEKTKGKGRASIVAPLPLEDAAVDKACEGASRKTQAKGAVADKKGKEKTKGKGRASIVTPLSLEDAAADKEGKPFPRVFVPTAASPDHIEAVVKNEFGDVASSRDTALVDTITADVAERTDRAERHASGAAAATKSLPRGFKREWSNEQRRAIVSHSTSGRREQQRDQKLPEMLLARDAADKVAVETPPRGVQEELDVQAGDGEGVTREFLTEEALESLGTPAGGEVDSDMTAIFKAIAQLSATCSATGCPFLWEAIYPQTPERVPCYNPSGRYLVKLFAGGHWRKVEVDDAIPVDATRSPVLAASENPVELWPLLLSKALYKLYRLGGYGLAREAAAATMKGDHQADRGLFVAFGLHSLTGWIPSIADGVPYVKDILVGDTPCISPEELRLPTLPPVDKEEETARARLEERRRRQALFLHKKRTPKKIERKVVSAQERSEVNSARVEKMGTLRDKLRRANRREVYMVCMPGEQACPVLAICSRPELSAEAATAITAAAGHSGGSPLVGRDNLVKSSTAGRSQSLQAARGEHNQPRPRVPEEMMRPDAEDQPVLGFLLQWETPDARNRRSSASVRDEEADFGDPDVVSKASRADEGGGRGEGTAADAGVENKGIAPSYSGVIGGGSHRWSSNEGQESGVDLANATASLATPVVRWLTPREIEQAGGVVVRVLTTVDKAFYTDLPCHWREVEKVGKGVGAPPGNAKARKSVTSNSISPKNKSKGGKGGKGYSNNGNKIISLCRFPHGKPRDGDRGASSSSTEEETISPEVERPPSEAVPCAALNGPRGTRARDPGCPPAIFLLITPSPKSEAKQSLPLAEENEDNIGPGTSSPIGASDALTTGGATAPRACSQEEDAGLNQDRTKPTSEANGMEGEGGSAETTARVESGGDNSDPTAKTPPGGGADPGCKTKHAHHEKSPELLEDDRECEDDHRPEQNVEAEHGEVGTGEEAEIVMCLWVDQPGSGGPGATSDGFASAVLQEVMPGASLGPREVSATAVVPAGRILLRARHKPELDGLPLKVTSGKIRLVKGGSPKVYRVVLHQLGLGCCVGFSCTHGVKVGDAGQIWEEAGHSQVTESGKYYASREGEWRILFRRAFRIIGNRPSGQEAINEEEDQPGALVATLVPNDVASENDTQKGIAARSANTDDHGDGPAAAAIVASPQKVDACHEASDIPGLATAGRRRVGSRGPVATTLVKAILHIPDEDARPSVRLAFVDEDGGTEMIQPLLYTNAIPLRPNRNGYTVLATACGRTKPLAKGAWRLQLLSDSLLLPWENPDNNEKKGGEVGDGKVSASRAVDGGKGLDGTTTVVTCQERAVYGGVYVPNKYLLFFRDVLTCTSPLPFAARLRSSLPGICLRLTFLDAATGELLRELQGGQVLQAVSVTPPQAPDYSDEATIPPPQMEATKRGKERGTGAAAAGEPTTAAPPGKIIIEAAIDAEMMQHQVPANLVSELPYYYQPTPEAFPHYVPPPRPVIFSRDVVQPLLGSTTDAASNDDQPPKKSPVDESAVAAGGNCHGGLQLDDSCPSRSRALFASVEAPTSGMVASTDEANGRTAEEVPLEKSEKGGMGSAVTLANEDEKKQLRWWLEIVGAGKVEMMHDTTRIDIETREFERWEAADPGRASRAALLWTQRQGAKVVHSGGQSSVESPSPAATTTATQSVEGEEDWIKARASALGVPVALEKKRQASRAKLQVAQVPPSGSSFSVPGCSSRPPSEDDEPSAATTPSSAVQIDRHELLRAREEDRVALRARAEEIESQWEAKRVMAVEAGKEEMAKQVAYIRGRGQNIRAERERFLIDRERIVQDMMTKAEARKEALEAEREAFETAAKVKGQGKPAGKKGKTGGK